MAYELAEAAHQLSSGVSNNSGSLETTILISIAEKRVALLIRFIWSYPILFILWEVFCPAYSLTRSTLRFDTKANRSYISRLVSQQLRVCQFPTLDDSSPAKAVNLNIIRFKSVATQFVEYATTTSLYCTRRTDTSVLFGFQQGIFRENSRDALNCL
mmetsp:Transcript_55319/g.165870  ORF Transcript_55319/g.165870 Transcript_55319/m.165870 type:complete len:157 (+) Transcript_55319:1308-1778(+)